MFRVLEQQRALAAGRSPWFCWLPVGIGLLVLYVPTYVTLWKGAWDTDDQAHGPLILAMVGWLFYRECRVLVDGEDRPWGSVGWPLLAVGLLLYVLGRSQDILLFEVGSHIPVLAGVVLLMRGGQALRGLWFPIVFLVFMVPLPGMLVDALTNPLKRNVSEAAEHLLYWAGYPIARSGVTLTIGQYQLLVADACSGMHSLYSLLALGFLYLYLVDHRDLLRNIVLASCIVPIAIGANIVRVVFLVLVTYYLGDEAGQGFLHGFAGMALFTVALLLLFLIDGLFGLVRRWRRSASTP
ncbi:MAG: exosortase B [Betaproteobacteria bacterium]|nr:exosortase B [Betaproteobacteria bacterium]